MINKILRRKFLAVVVAMTVLASCSMVIWATPTASPGELPMPADVAFTSQNTIAGSSIFPAGGIVTELRSVARIKLTAAGETGSAGPPLPQQLPVRLVTRGNRAILVNGAHATSGAAILTGSIIETPDQVGATIDLASMGTLDIAANSKLRLDFDQHGNVKVTLIHGCMILSLKEKTIGQVDTTQGTIGKTDRKKGGVLDVCLPLGAAAALVNKGAAARGGARSETSAPASVWNLGVLAGGKTYPTEISVTNASCKGKHTFLITLEGSPWLKIDGPEKIENVGTGETRIVRALVDLSNVNPGEFVGMIGIHCVTCPPKCTQSTSKLEAHLTVQ